MKKYEMIPVLFWIGLSLLIMFFSYRLGLGEFHNPGPGLFPFILGFSLFLISFYFLISSVFKPGRREETVKRQPYRAKFFKVGFVLGSLFFYAILLETLGYLITTMTLLALLFGVMEPKRWKFVIIASILTALITYFGFIFLGVRFPGGILKLR